MIQLSININKIALIRNSRKGNNPDLVDYALTCIHHGAQGITVHPRPDQRHIRANDCMALKQALANHSNQVELNIEGNPFAGHMPSNRSDVGDYPGFMEIIRQVKPDQCTLVPDTDSQLTSDHGFDLTKNTTELNAIIYEIKNLGVRVSLFMDANCDQIKLAKKIGADRVELYTGPYAWADDLKHALIAYEKAAKTAFECGLGINAGHDLNIDNLAIFAKLSGLQEVSIGHALTIDSLHMGLKSAIMTYLNVLQ